MLEIPTDISEQQELRFQEHMGLQLELLTASLSCRILRHAADPLRM
jgi:hypothetical protein